MNTMTAETSVGTADSAHQVNSAADGHMTLWNSVRETDPAYTKHFTRTGGFSGTAINATYQVQKATSLFGPIGIGWGYNLIEERFKEGASLGFDAQGASLGNEVVHIVRIELWYKWNGETGKVQQFGQTTFVGKTKHYVFTDEEAPKKSLTDALSKCLSLLGFGSDVYMGLYDDQKYVDALHERFADNQGAATAVPVNGQQSAQQNTASGQQTSGARYQHYMQQIKSGHLKPSPQLHSLINSDVELSQMERATLIAALPLSLDNAAGSSNSNGGNPAESIFL
jgi:hypothetical protein